MRLLDFEYFEPKTLREAVKIYSSDTKGSALLGGGTDLLVNMKHQVIRPKRLINLKKIPKLSYISFGKDGLRVGALTTLHDLSSSSLIGENYPVLSQAASEVGAYAHQVMGTVGGNLCQGNRCKYYNQSVLWRSVRPPCYKVGGDRCYVVPKSDKCHSTYCGDMAPIFCALGAQVRVIGPVGERSFPLKRLYTHDGKKPLSLRRAEILKEIFVPPPSGRSVYLKWRHRGSLEFPIVSLAINLERGGDGTVKGSRVFFSAVGSGPVEAIEVERMLKGTMLDDGVIEKASSEVTREISPMRTSIYSPSYKRRMAGILIREALEEMKK